MNKKEETERHVVLVEPEVHWNTGNIGRTCLGANTALHLIKPLGFSLNSRQVKRAGLDYWYDVDLHVWDNFQSFLEKLNPGPDEIVFFAKKGTKSFWKLPQKKRLFLVFGSETKGLPASLLEKYNESVFHIPINNKIRCLNLSTAVGIVLYESLRSWSSWHGWHP